MTTEKVLTLDEKFKKAFQDGKLVQVHVGKWGMSFQLDEKDIGVENVPAIVRLGKKMLIPDEVRKGFNRVETSARNFLKGRSFKFPIADAHFVVQKQLVPLLEQLSLFKDEYQKLTDEFIKQYPAHKEQILSEYPALREGLEPCYPPIDHVAKKFYFDVAVFEVAFPQEIKEVSVAEITAQNQAVEEYKGKYKQQMDAQYQTALSHMDDFVKEAARSLRGQVVETFETIAKKMASGELVTGKNIKSIKTMLSAFEGMDFFDDAVVKEQLAQVQSLVNSDKDFKEDATAITALRTAIDNTLTVAKNMSDIDTITGRYFRKIEV